MNYNSVLITGGLGQVGSYLSEKLVSMGVGVTILDNMTSTIGTHAKGATFVRGDIRDKSLVKELVKDADAVIHCAAQISVAYSIQYPFFDADNNITGTLNLLTAARESNIKRFVYFSSAAAYGNPVYLPVNELHPLNPLNPYGVSKLSGEKYAMAFYNLYGFPATGIRPFNIYSPRQDPSNPYSGVIPRFIDRVIAGDPPIIYGDGTQTRDFVSVHDIVDMVVLMLDKGSAVGKVFNCGTGKATSINELAKVVIGLCGKDGARPEHHPERLGDGKHSHADISLAKKLLGYSPRVGLKAGLKEIIEHKRENTLLQPAIAR